MRSEKQERRDVLLDVLLHIVKVYVSVFCATRVTSFVFVILLLFLQIPRSLPHRPLLFPRRIRYELWRASSNIPLKLCVRSPVRLDQFRYIPLRGLSVGVTVEQASAGFGRTLNECVNVGTESRYHAQNVGRRIRCDGGRKGAESGGAGLELGRDLGLKLR